jgi:nitrogen regulatory protein PII
MTHTPFELILCSVPAGPESQLFIERLTGELGLWSVTVGRARQAIADRSRWRTRLVQTQEMDEISILAPAHRAQEAFDLACEVLRVREPGRGMVYRAPVERAVAVALPEAGTQSTDDLSTVVISSSAGSV